MPQCCTLVRCALLVVGCMLHGVRLRVVCSLCALYATGMLYGMLPAVRVARRMSSAVRWRSDKSKMREGEPAAYPRFDKWDGQLVTARQVRKWECLSGSA